MELHEPRAERMGEGSDLVRFIKIRDQHAEYRRRQALDDRRGSFLGEILAMNREPQRKSQIANAALLKHLRLRRIDHTGNLDLVLFEHESLGTRQKSFKTFQVYK